MTRASRILRYLVAGLLLIVGGALVLGWWVVRRPLARLDGSVAIGGLKDGVIVDRDGSRRPWIRAKSLQDVVTAQGYVMAQDRLWQMDLLGRAAWLPGGFADYDELLMTSADDAVAALQNQTGQPNESAWNWGRLHPLDMVHPLGRTGLLHRMLSIGPYEQGGTIDTVRAMGVGHGPAMRFVADLEDFDGSLMEIPAGESGQYGSPYYRDQFAEWFAGRGIPAAFWIAAEDAARAHRLTLLPADRK